MHDIIFPGISLQAFPPRNQYAGYFFLKSFITPSKKSTKLLLLRHILICQSFLKPFEKKWVKTL